MSVPFAGHVTVGLQRLAPAATVANKTPSNPPKETRKRDTRQRLVRPRLRPQEQAQMACQVALNVA